MAVGEIVPALRRESANVGKDFGTLVRERRRRWGLPLPIQDKILPFRSVLPASEEIPPEAESMPPATIEISAPVEAATPQDEAPAPSAPDAPVDVQAAWRMKLAEQRLQTVVNELQAASARGAPPWEIRRWEQAYDDEMWAYEIAYTAFHE